MAIDYGPFDSGVGANRTESWWREFFRHLTGSGVLNGERSEFAVSQHSTGADMSVDVAAGTAFIRGHWIDSDAVVNKAINAAHATLARIDRVVLRADFAANTMSIEVLEGVAAASPAAPALTQSTSRWEISLAQVSVPAADTTIATAQITDEREVISPGNPTSSDGAVVRRFAAQSIPNDTVAAISFDDEVHDVGGYYNPAAPTRLTVPAGKAGYYVVLGFACLGPNGVGMRQGILAHNGAHFRIVSFLPPNASNPAGQMVSGRRYLGVGDYVELMVTQNSGGALDTPAGGTWGVPRSPSLDLYYLGA